MILVVRRLAFFVFLLAVSATFAVAAPQAERDNARKKLEQRYGAVSQETMLGTLNPPNAEDLRLFLAAGIPADEVMKIEMGDQIVPVSPLQFVLMFACDGDATAEVVKVLLDAGANPNRRDPRDSVTPLMRASGCPQVMRQLLQAGADPNFRTSKGDTALRHAILFGTPETMRILIKGGADVQADRKELLKQAARSADKLRVIKQALASRSSAPARRSSRSLGDALFGRDADGLRAHLESGTWKVAAVRNDPPLHYLVNSCRKGEDARTLVAIVQLLLDHGAKATDTAEPLKETPLHAAAKQCPVEAVRALLAAGADPNAKNAVNQAPLLGAVMANRPDVVEALLDSGAKVDRDSRFFAKTKPEIQELLKKRR